MDQEDLGLTYKGTITLNKFRGADIEFGANGKPRHVPGTGELIESRKIHNVFLNVGKVWAIQRLFADTSAVVSGTAADYFYVGCSTSGNNNGATATDTTAQCTFASGGQISFVYQTGGTAGSMSGTATFITATANGAITEAGIFAGTPANAPLTTGDGVFVARAQFTAINKTSSDTLQVKWDVVIS